MLNRVIRRGGVAPTTYVLHVSGTNKDRFLPGLGGLRDFEQRLTGLVPGHAIPLPANSPNPVPDSLGVKRGADSQSKEQRLDDALRDSFPASDPVPFQH